MNYLTNSELAKIALNTKENANYHGGSNKYQRVYWNSKDPRFEVVESKVDPSVVIIDHKPVPGKSVSYFCSNQDGEVVTKKMKTYTDTYLGTLVEEKII